MRRILEYIGFILMLIGVAGVDGKDSVIALIMAIAGLAILYTSAKREYPHQRRPSTVGIYNNVIYAITISILR